MVSTAKGGEDIYTIGKVRGEAVNMEEIGKMLDLAQMIIEELNKNEEHAPYLIITIDENRLSIGFYEDPRVASIMVDMEKGVLSAYSPKIELPDLITEIYEDVKWSDLKIGEWKGENLKNIMKKYPEVFISYESLKKKAEELSRKYGINIKVEIDEYGYQYTKIVYPITGTNLKTVRDKTLELLKILREHSKEEIEYPYIDSDEEPWERIIEYLKIARTIIMKVSSDKAKIKLLLITNYSWPNISISYTTNEKHLNKLNITQTHGGYTIMILTNDDEKRRALLNTGEYLENGKYSLRLKKPIKTKAELMRWLEENIRKFI